MSKDTPVQRITLAGNNYVLMREDEYHALAAVANTLSASFNRPVTIGMSVEGEPDFLGNSTKLRAWRKFRGMTLAELGDKVGATHATLSRVETGQQYPKAAMWRALAQALGVTVDDILPEE